MNSSLKKISATSVLFLLLAAQNALATQVETQIYDIIKSIANEESLVLSTLDGVAYRLPKAATSELILLEKAKNNNFKVMLTTGDDKNADELIIKKVEIIKGEGGGEGGGEGEPAPSCNNTNEANFF